MYIKQVSVFLENRVGKLQEALEVIKQEKINILTLCMVDTADFGMFRMITTDPNRACQALNDAGLSSFLTDVIAIKLPNKEGQLEEAVAALTSKNINIEYMYSMITKDSTSCIIIRPADLEEAESALKNKGLVFFTNEELATL